MAGEDVAKRGILPAGGEDRDVLLAGGQVRPC